MKTKLHFIFFSLVITNNCFGQITFQKVNFGYKKMGGFANAVLPTTDGGYIISGDAYISDSGNTAIYLVKINKYGDLLWTNTFGGPVPDYGYSIQQTIDGGYIVAGFTGSLNIDGNFYILKTNSSGDTIWTKDYGLTGGGGAMGGCSVQQTNDSCYIIAGIALAATGEELYLLKINAKGDTIWSKTYGGCCYGYCVKQTSDLGYIICTTFSYDTLGLKVCLIKTDSIGDTLWIKTYGGINYDYGYSVQQTTDGGYIVTGLTLSFGAGNGDVYLIKTNLEGDTLWTKTYGGPNFDYGHDVQQTNDGGYIITGNTENFGEDHIGVYLIKTDSIGDTLWTKTYGNNPYGGSEGYSVRQTTDGGYIIAGNTDGLDSLPIFAGIYLIKTDPNGNTGCYQSNTNTIVSSTNTNVGNPHLIIGSGCLASTTSTIVGSGGNDTTICLSVGIKELTINNNFAIYPNPATNRLTIHSSSFHNEAVTVSVMNVLGQTMQEEKVNWSNDISMNIKNLAAGIYFLEMKSENGNVVKRFVKE